MNRTVLVLMMAVTVEALIEYAKTFGKAIIEKQWKSAARRHAGGCRCSGRAAMLWCWGGLLRRVGCEFQRGMDWHCAYRHFCEPRRELCERPCEEVAGVGRGEN